jgi:general secretion pathway protein A
MAARAMPWAAKPSDSRNATITLGRRDLYRDLCHALAILYGSAVGDVFFSITKHVEDLAREHTVPVLVDKNHVASRYTRSPAYTAQLRGRTASRSLSRSSLWIARARRRLSLRRYCSLHSCLTYRLFVDPPVARRQRRLHPHAPRPPSAAPRSALTPTPSPMLHEAGSGSVRDVDRVAHNALILAARKKRHLVERDIIEAECIRSRLMTSGYALRSVLRKTPQLGSVKLLSTPPKSSSLLCVGGFRRSRFRGRSRI